jgi:hypothetical protein
MVFMKEDFLSREQEFYDQWASTIDVIRYGY